MRPNTISKTPQKDNAAYTKAKLEIFSFKIGTASKIVINGPIFMNIDTFTMGRTLMHSTTVSITYTILPNAMKKVENSNNLKGYVRE